MKKNINFENFYVYEGNKVAFLAAQKIVQFPGEIFNPLYIYAAGSYGKTYFLWAIYNELSKKEPALLFTYREFEEYLQKTTKFDTAILVDDINQVNEKFQDAILGMIDIMISKNKQICFSGNAPPRELRNLGQKIISRLEGGLVCDIQPPREIALVEFIKKKSEERGFIIPDEIALELTHISGNSLHTIEGMLNRLAAYASLGNVTFDINTVRLILKEFYPKGIYSPVASLVEELKKSADEILTEISESKDIRTDYKEKIYIWEMKGFDTSSIKPFLDGDLEKLTDAYNTFIKKVEKLIELQKEFGTIDTSKFPEEALKIETMLFSPDKIEEIEKLLNSIKEALKPQEKKSFANYLIGECNKTVLELYEKSIIPNLGKKFNPYIIFGEAGLGKTFLCENIAEDLRNRGYNPVLWDFEKGFDNLSKLVDEKDTLLIDNFQKLFYTSSKIRDSIIGEITEYIKNEKGVFIFSEPLGGDVTLTEDERLIFEFGIEAFLNEPDAQIIDAYLKAKLNPDEYEQVKNKGIPICKSFKAIEQFIEDLRKPIVIEEKPAEELISLGLPGEEIFQPEPVEITQVLEPEAKPEPAPITGIPLVKIKEERLIIQEFADELIEDNYQSKNGDNKWQ
jgi:chromosomal replication initiation ATPase DnaA|uniref:Chromosomal replication initiator protein DnaA ATPAse domain-containing protein n=1 Tax=candidate division WOR-3 bacterium TaxID=2052148 RepID=A0A7V3RI02_UNCW3